MTPDEIALLEFWGTTGYYNIVLAICTSVLYGKPTADTGFNQHLDGP